MGAIIESGETRLTALESDAIAEVWLRDGREGFRSMMWPILHAAHELRAGGMDVADILELLIGAAHDDRWRSGVDYLARRAITRMVVEGMEG